VSISASAKLTKIEPRARFDLRSGVGDLLRVLTLHDDEQLQEPASRTSNYLLCHLRRLFTNFLWNSSNSRVAFPKISIRPYGGNEGS
jgi:hypothetical protein